MDLLLENRLDFSGRRSLSILTALTFLKYYHFIFVVHVEMTARKKKLIYSAISILFYHQNVSLTFLFKLRASYEAYVDFNILAKIWLACV